MESRVKFSPVYKTTSGVYMVNDYVVGKTLGEGTYGKVKLGMHLLSQQKVAIKFIKDVAESKYLAREVNIMKLLSHPNVVKLHDVVENHDNNQTILIMEYVGGGELFDYILSKDHLDEMEARKFFRQMISALRYCHQHLVIHRDLKPENILLDENRNIKITDFGVSNVMRPGVLLHSRCGSPMYASPELLLEKPYIGPEVDIWALGVILYAMVTGCMPWIGEDMQTQIQNAAYGRYVEPLEVSEDCQDIISRMLKPDSANRATLTELFLHPWVNKGAKIPLSAALTYHTPPNKSDIDSEILDNMEKLGFNKEKVVSHLLANNMMENCVGIYYLMQKNKHTEQEKKQNADQDVEKEISFKGRKEEETKADENTPRVRRHSVQVVLRTDYPDLSEHVCVHSKSESKVLQKSPPSPGRKFLNNIFKKKKAQVHEDSFTGEEADDYVHTLRNSEESSVRLRPVRVTPNTAFLCQKSAGDIILTLDSRLSDQNIAFKKKAKKGVVYSCRDTEKNIKFELEVCDVVAHAGMKTVVHTRKKGDLIEYKKLLARLVLEKL